MSKSEAESLAGGGKLNVSKPNRGVKEDDVLESCNKPVRSGEDEDGQSPASILPPEIWEQILMEVVHPLDIYSCFKTCQLWRDILKSSESFWFFGSTFSSIFPYLEKEDVLNCRLVCKYWNECVDAALENPEHLKPPNGNASLSCHYKSISSPSAWAKKWKDFVSPYQLTIRNYPVDLDDHDSDDEFPEGWEKLVESVRCLDRFNSKMKLHPKNPLIGRSLSIEIEINAAHPMDPIWYGVEDIFKHVGGHLRYCDIRILHTPSYQLTSDELNNVIRTCLTEAPHLRKLRFWYPRSKVKASNDDQVIILPENILETLELNGSGTEANLELSLLKTYSNQLGKLQLDHWLTSYSKLDWSNLTELQVDQVWSEEHLSGFLQLRCPKLRKLSICLNMKGEEQLRKLLEILRQFPSLLSFHFTLDYMCPDLTDGEALSLPLHLCAPENLKTLGVGHSSKIAYGFLQAFPSIQCLHLVNVNAISKDIFDVEDKPEVKEIVEVNGPLETGKIHDSNIWKSLPKLRHISFRENEQSPTKTMHWEREVALENQ